VCMRVLVGNGLCQLQRYVGKGSPAACQCCMQRCGLSALPIAVIELPDVGFQQWLQSTGRTDLRSRALLPEVTGLQIWLGCGSS
jgi:hypothetical protein